MAGRVASGPAGGVASQVRGVRRGALLAGRRAAGWPGRCGADRAWARTRPGVPRVRIPLTCADQSLLETLGAFDQSRERPFQRERELAVGMGDVGVGEEPLEVHVVGPSVATGGHWSARILRSTARARASRRAASSVTKGGSTMPSSIVSMVQLNGQRRMTVRRVRALPNAQSELFPAWFHYPFATNRTDQIALVEAEHRRHAVIELAIRDLKAQALAHFPSGDFSANSAWTVIAALAHNMRRWTSVIGLPGKTVLTARTLRRRMLTLAKPRRISTARPSSGAQLDARDSAFAGSSTRVPARKTAH
jgi:hypothetical protein